ncbi:hypothetical protein R1sor_022392 [Riccia sorocarpa]|uniref:Uncharacterized protein n=1 Tax=Riccia sorocarpa TaxID=122646 RepID=A0ABD3GNJ4_9MARC
MAANWNQAVSNTSQPQEDITIRRLIQQFSDLELGRRMQLEELLEMTIESSLYAPESKNVIHVGPNSRNDARPPQLSHGDRRPQVVDRFIDEPFDDINCSHAHPKASIGNLEDFWQSWYGREDFRPSAPPLDNEKLPQLSGSNIHEPESWRPLQPRVESLHQDDNFPFEVAIEEFIADSEADAISAHDEKFARFLSSLPESEWEAVGCQLNKLFPFPADHTASSSILKGKSPLYDDFYDSFTYEEAEQTPRETCKICLDAEIALANSYCVNDR